jgi:hypothetical protein
MKTSNFRRVAIVPNGVLRKARAPVSAAGFSVIALTLGVTLATAATCPFDTGGSDALNDGVVLTRYALDIRGAPMTASTRYASLDPLQVKNNIECVGCALDMNGDGQIDTVDTTIIARHLAGFSGAALTNGLSLGSAPSATRPTSAAITSFLASGCAVGGAINAFTQGGNAFGAPAVLGTTDGQPLTLGIGGSAGVRILPSTTAGEPNIIGGHADNGVSSTAVKGAFIGGGGVTGGYPNTVSANYGTIGGGADQLINGNYGTVGGGISNAAGGISGRQPNATVAGGSNNQARGESSAIGGGFDNIAQEPHSTVSGGTVNRALANGATVGGGEQNAAVAPSSVVAGGSNNTADAIFSAVVGGQRNSASGVAATVLGGTDNTATGDVSVAAGRYAVANHGSFVWNSYYSANNLPTRTDSFRVQAANGFDVAFGPNRDYFVAFNADTAGFIIVTSTGAALSTGGVWTNNSDRAKKRDFSPITAQTAQEILRKVVALPLSTWSYSAEDAKIRHIGPMAQDFWKAFGLGYDDKTMTDIDARGVTLAAIQGLNQIVKEKDAEIAGLRKAHHEMLREMAIIKRKLGM